MIIPTFASGMSIAAFGQPLGGLSLGLILLPSSDRMITRSETAGFAARADPFVVEPIQNDDRVPALGVVESRVETARVTSTRGRNRPSALRRGLTLGKRIA